MSSSLSTRYSSRLSGAFFFFSSRRRHTRCSRDWSSDVCSSDLDGPEHASLAGVEVPLDLDHAAPVREHPVGVAAIAVIVPLDLGRLLVATLDAQRTALGEEAPRDPLEVGPVLDRTLGEQLQTLAHGARALLEQPADHHAGARGHGGAAVGHQAGIG